MNNPDPNNPTNRSISIFVLTMIVGTATFGAVSLFVHFTNGSFTMVDEQIAEWLWISYLVIALIVVAVSGRNYRKNLDGLNVTMSQEEMKSLFQYTVRHIATCEGIALLGITLFLVFGNLLLFLPVGIILIEMLRVFFKIRSTNNAPF